MNLADKLISERKRRRCFVYTYRVMSGCLLFGPDGSYRQAKRRLDWVRTIYPEAEIVRVTNWISGDRQCGRSYERKHNGQWMIESEAMRLRDLAEECVKRLEGLSADKKS